jgi:hypothetical protein
VAEVVAIGVEFLDRARSDGQRAADPLAEFGKDVGHEEFEMAEIPY